MNIAVFLSIVKHKRMNQLQKNEKEHVTLFMVWFIKLPLLRQKRSTF